MKNWKIYICADCGKEMAATVWACRCGGSNFIECTDPQIVSVEQTEPINNMMFFTTEWAEMVTKHEQQIDDLNTRLDKLFEINRNATALLEANLNDSEAGAKKHIKLMRKHIEMEREILDGKEDETRLEGGKEVNHAKNSG